MSGQTDPHLPTITAPLMRYLGVVDKDRSLAFYRDVLGFEVRSADGDDGAVEVARGPARIQLGSDDRAPDYPMERRAPGSAILFIETSDVDAMHAAIRARGGSPTEPEKVNWIKMRMFEVRDPDGHALWFGQTYNEPDRPGDAAAPPPMMREIMPELPLDDVAAGIEHYRDVLGFSINYQQDDLGVMYRDAVTLLLIARTPRHTGIGSAGLYVENVDTLHAELVAKGAYVQGPPISYPWGLRSFQVLDPEGNRISFSQTFE